MAVAPPQVQARLLPASGGRGHGPSERRPAAAIACLGGSGRKRAAPSASGRAERSFRSRGERSTAARLTSSIRRQARRTGKWNAYDLPGSSGVAPRRCRGSSFRRLVRRLRRRGPTKQECVAANEGAQISAALGSCARREAACAVRVGAVPGAGARGLRGAAERSRRRVPSVVFVARDEAGNDMSSVVVSDGRAAVRGHLDGTAAQVDRASTGSRSRAEGFRRRRKSSSSGRATKAVT